ncbi:MAG: WXG100 family type VII secretion target [Propionibacteriaceae bacterium]|nr:WXG100 family type VII secretion target [Propionibacteriaceae bacterium]
MAVVGGELATLKTLKTSLDKASNEAADLKSTLDTALGNTVWTGVNADKFRSAWQQFSPTFTNLQNALAEASNSVKSQHNALAAATGAPDQI